MLGICAACHARRQPLRVSSGGSQHARPFTPTFTRLRAVRQAVRGPRSGSGRLSRVQDDLVFGDGTREQSDRCHAYPAAPRNIGSVRLECIR